MRLIKHHTLATAILIPAVSFLCGMAYVAIGTPWALLVIPVFFAACWCSGALAGMLAARLSPDDKGAGT